ncbi:MAG: AAA family ATPase [Pseudomonadota bacterium]
MIITRLYAKNVLKYGTLLLEDLPQKGVIGISGPNESGKSTIGETICFALFGRTWSLDEKSRQKVIRWGENRCLVMLRFVAADGNEYEITRHLDSDGNHSARLSIVGDEEHITKGADAVKLLLQQILGIKYDEYIESFYLAQRELTAPHPHSDAIKSMAGILTLEKSRDEFEREIAHFRKGMVNADSQHIHLQEELETLGIIPGHLDEIETQRAAIDAACDACEQRGERLQEQTGTYLATLNELQTAKAKRGKARFYEMLLLFAGAMLAGVWLVMTLLPERAVSVVLHDLLAKIPFWSDAFQPLLVYLAGAFGLIAVLLWRSGSAAASKMRQLESSTGGYHQLFEEIVDKRNSGEDLDVLGLADDAVELQIDAAQTSTLSAWLKLHQANDQEVQAGANRETTWLNQVINLQEVRLRELDEEIGEERERVHQATGLQHQQDSFQHTVEDHSQQIKVRALAIQLLEGAMERVAKKFNRELRDGAGYILPDLTQGEYQHIKLDDDLDVQLFSAGKGDFMEFDEVSSGTQRQVLLAVRLSMSQALADDALDGNQFLFLDEPFAFFDHERASQALQSLSSLEHLPQIWIIAQEFPEEAEFARKIDCRRIAVDLSST